MGSVWSSSTPAAIAANSCNAHQTRNVNTVEDDYDEYKLQKSVGSLTLPLVENDGRDAKEVITNSKVIQEVMLRLLLRYLPMNRARTNQKR